jgi:hypothetical protein
MVQGLINFRDDLFAATTTATLVGFERPNRMADSDDVALLCEKAHILAINSSIKQINLKLKSFLATANAKIYL